MKFAIASILLLTLAPVSIAQKSLAGLDPRGLNDLYGTILLAADHPLVGNELFGATAGGGALIEDLNLGSGHGFYDGDPEVGFPTPLKGAVLGSDFYFFAYLANENIGLGRTDGTTAGTAILSEFPQRTSGGFKYGYDFEGAALTDRLVFSAVRLNNTWRVFSFDAPTAGLTLLATLPNQARQFVRFGNDALFVESGVNRRLWRTDGTQAGTGAFHSLPLGSSIDLEQPMTVVGDHVFFSADVGDSGMELWRTDGTSVGTSLVFDVNPGVGDSNPRSMVAMGEVLYFTADDGGGPGLWRSDGTQAGTIRVAQIPGSSDDGPRQLTPLGDRLIFSNVVSELSDRLYAYDHGTGSLELLHVFSTVGANPHGVRWLTAIGSRRLFFQGLEAKGAESWVTDGTSLGTKLHEDVKPGLGWGQPAEFTLSNGRLFFGAGGQTASSGLHNRWIGATAQPIGVGCSASGRLPRLRADDPVLGGSSEIQLEGAEAATPVFVFAGPKAQPLVLGSGCATYLDLAARLLIASGTTDAAGAWSSGSISLPNDPGLEGVQLTLQAIVGPTGTQPLGFDLSSAVLLTFGS